MTKKGGWYGESKRHSLAAKGIKTGSRTPQQMRSDARRVVGTDYSDDRDDRGYTLQERADDLDLSRDSMGVDDEVKIDFIKAMDDQNEDVEGYEWKIYDDEEADEAVKEYIEESVWAFNSDFLAGETGIDADAFSSIQDKCESANPAIRSMIEGTCGMNRFVEDAVSADGRGHFLSSYDGEEFAFQSGGKWYFAYRE
jgi:hypothetical protein